MRNSHVMLLGLLGLLLAREGVEGRKCYECDSCADLPNSEETTDCTASCLTTITCRENNKHFVTRSCGIGNKDAGCIPSASSANTFECYCNEDNCDALAFDRDICNTAAASTVASLVLVFAAVLLPPLLLS